MRLTLGGLYSCVSYVIYSEFWFNIVMKTGGVNAALFVGDMSAVAFAFDEAFFYALLLIVGGVRLRLYSCAWRG